MMPKFQTLCGKIDIFNISYILLSKFQTLCGKIVIFNISRVCENTL